MTSVLFHCHSVRTIPNFTDICYSIHLCWHEQSHHTVPEKGFPSWNKAILIHRFATCPPHYEFSHRAVEMCKGRTVSEKGEILRYEKSMPSLYTHGLYSPSPGNECMQPAEFNSLLVYYYLKIRFCIPFYRGFTFQQNIQKIHTIEKKR